MSIYLSNSLLSLQLNILLLPSVSLAVLWYVLAFCAFCSFVIGFCNWFVAWNVWQEPGDVLFVFLDYVSVTWWPVIAETEFYVSAFPFNASVLIF